MKNISVFFCKGVLIVSLFLMPVFLYAQQHSFSRDSIDDSAGFSKTWTKSDTAGYKTLSTKFHICLNSNDRCKIRTVRLSVPWPDSGTIFQKVIPLNDIRYYVPDSNGKIGGFIAVAADVKYLRSSGDIIQGLRLDYSGTHFHSDSGYAVIRFRLPQDAIKSYLRIPCSDTTGYSGKALECKNSPPFTGTGFTGSTLGNGGFPEYQLWNRCCPKDNAAVFIVNKNGQEALFSIYDSQTGKWKKP